MADRAKGRVSIGSLLLDRLRYEVRLDRKPIKLTPKEFALLWTLGASPGRVFPRGELLRTVWGPGIYVGHRTVDSHIKALRKKLSPRRRSGRPTIETVWSVGYRLTIPPLRRSSTRARFTAT